MDITETASYKEAMEDVKAGRVYHAENTEDMFQQILGYVPRWLYQFFKKGLKRCEKRGLNLLKIFDAIKLLETTGSLPHSYRHHKLKGNRDGQWECHIESDWLMVWEQNDEILTLLFLGTGSHSDLF